MTLPQFFRQQGYFTASLGKILHLGFDASGRPAPFQDAKSWVDCRNFAATPTGLRGEGRNLTDGRLAWCRWLAAEGGDEDQPDGQIAAEAVRLIEAQRDLPFFLGVGFHKPHDPFHAPKKYFDLYPIDQIQLAREPDDRTPDVTLAIPRGTDFSRFTDRERREFRRAYQAGISFTDAQVGKLLDALDRKQLWESTIVVFMGDHGYHLGEHGWWNKVTVFELCARTPLIVWAPGARSMGRSAAGLVEFVDLYPTIAELCGLEPPAGLEGTSFRPLLDDSTRPGKRAAYTQVVRGPGMGRSVRSDRWRYTEWVDGKQGVELYDHNVDPLEYHNLASDPEHAATLAAMKALLHAPETPFERQESGLGRRGENGFEADVVDPHLTDLGAAADPEVEGERGGLALGAEDPFDPDPAADSGEDLFMRPVGQDLPGGGRVLVLGDPGAAFALGAGGDQVPEPEPHLRAIADGPFGKAVILVPRDMGFEVEAVGGRDVMTGVTAVFGRHRPGGLRLRQVLLAVHRHDRISKRRRAQVQLDRAEAEQGIVITVEEMLVLEAEPDPHRRARGDAQNRRPLGRNSTGRRAGASSGSTPGGGLGGRGGGRLGITGPDEQNPALAAPLRLVGRGDYLGRGRRPGRARDDQRRPARQGMAGNP